MAAPTVYFIYGEDEIGIAAFVGELRAKLGDPSTADLNTTRLSGKVDQGELKRSLAAMPFLASRRLVILDSTLSPLRAGDERTNLLKLIENCPSTAAIVLIERNEFKDPKNDPMWVKKWADSHGESVLIRAFLQPKGRDLERWIVDYAREQGGVVTPLAAQHLANLIGADTRLAATEVDKLLAYVNYSRSVEVDDVDLLTGPVNQADIFKMVDALGARNGRLAMTLLRELLSERDANMVFGMIVRQFRLLLTCKELFAENQSPAVIAKELGLPEFVIQKLTAQARNFGISTLDDIYLQLADLDRAIKTGEMEWGTALDSFVGQLMQGSAR